MHRLMAAALDEAVAEIRTIQARAHSQGDPAQPRWPRSCSSHAEAVDGTEAGRRQPRRGQLGLITADLQGVIRHAREPAGEWNEVGRIPGTPAALEGVADELLAATHESRVLSSHDGGKTWRDLLNARRP